MAFTKQSSIGLGVTDGQATGAISANLTETSSGTDWEFRPYTTSNAWTAIPLGSLASFDLLAVKNTDPAISVDLAVANDNTGIFSTLTPGRFSFIAGKSSATYYVKAASGTPVIQIGGVEP